MSDHHPSGGPTSDDETQDRAPDPDRSTISLCMIVKDEANIIGESLASVADHIDTYSIVDTGSTDTTIAVIEEFFDRCSIPGVIHRRPWVNFGHNRTEALELARGRSDYLLMVDADDVVHFPGPLGRLGADGYRIMLRRGPLHYRCTLLTRAEAPWRYEGPVHEYPLCDADHTVEPLDERWWIESRALGARAATGDTYQRDAALLQAYLEDHPDDPRSVFYLAQSLHDAGDHQAALTWYRRRAGLGGWAEEAFMALYRAGQILVKNDASEAEVLETLVGAWELRPIRAEPLHTLALWYRQQGTYSRALLAARNAAALSRPTEDVLFVEDEVYRWRARDELALALYYTGCRDEAAAIWREILDHQELSPVDQARLRDNLSWAERAD
jgi:glycosyltransferase involved in cell wall biosynthesis